ncbi:MAG: hypothetical protein JW892_06515, partial [Anaerolineae bacterium]|nr:hypothetical protein [Anaerolineae bacterium]
CAHTAFCQIGGDFALPTHFRTESKIPGHKGVHFRMETAISSASTEHSIKLIFGGGAKPRRQKSIFSEIFAPVLKRTPCDGYHSHRRNLRLE